MRIYRDNFLRSRGNIPQFYIREYCIRYVNLINVNFIILIAIVTRSIIRCLISLIRVINVNSWSERN